MSDDPTLTTIHVKFTIPTSLIGDTPHVDVAALAERLLREAMHRNTLEVLRQMGYPV